MRETGVRSLGRDDPLEKEMAAYSSILAWEIPWTEELLAGYSLRGFQKSRTQLRTHRHTHTHTTHTHYTHTHYTHTHYTHTHTQHTHNTHNTHTHTHTHNLAPGFLLLCISPTMPFPAPALSHRHPSIKNQRSTLNWNLAGFWFWVKINHTLSCRSLELSQVYTYVFPTLSDPRSIKESIYASHFLLSSKRWAQHFYPLSVSLISFTWKSFISQN